MPIYNDLNDVRLDLSPYEECRLSQTERKRWERRVRRKLRVRSPSFPRRRIGAAAACVLALGAALSFGQASIAEIPLTRMFENVLGRGSDVDYSAYKTAIGETAENAQGRMTLNEVMIEGDRLLINATFIPAAGVAWDDSRPLLPHVTVNGVEGQWQGMSTGQSPAPDGNGYSIFGSVNLEQLTLGERTHVKIAYDVGNGPSDSALQAKQPWVFDVEVPTSAIRRDTVTIPFETTIRLDGYGEVALRKAIVSPVSTLLYYDDRTTRPAEQVTFKLVSSDGQEVARTQSAIYRFSVDGQTSLIRFDPIDLKKDSYSLIPLSSRTGRPIGEPIELRP